MNVQKVSLIVSTYNWPDALRLVLMSIARQTVLPFEVIVADDGSRDDTRQLIETFQKNYPCQLLHVWQEDKGFRAGQIRNKAIAKTSGEYIIQIDGDIIIEEHFIEDHLSMVKDNCFVIGSRINLGEEFTKQIIKKQTIDLKGKRFNFNGIRIKSLSKFLRFRYKRRDLYYGRGCNIAFWRKDLIAVNGYNEELEGWGAEDTELIVRLINAGVRRQFLKFGAVAFHIYHNYLSRDKVDYNFNTILKNTIDTKMIYCEDGLNKYQ